MNENPRNDRIPVAFPLLPQQQWLWLLRVSLMLPAGLEIPRGQRQHPWSSLGTLPSAWFLSHRGCSTSACDLWSPAVWPADGPASCLASSLTGWRSPTQMFSGSNGKQCEVLWNGRPVHLKCLSVLWGTVASQPVTVMGEYDSSGLINSYYSRSQQSRFFVKFLRTTTTHMWSMFDLEATCMTLSSGWHFSPLRSLCINKGKGT